LFSIKNIENEIAESEKKKLTEELATVYESIERIKKFVQELVHLQNPEIIDYFEENRMIKTD